ncbi:MAG: hypothetical protein K6A65_01455 [Succinivibrionaceae bacterium]|nr:hypothetical protein [Succinivibrionaceae bacterium]
MKRNLMVAALALAMLPALAQGEVNNSEVRPAYFPPVPMDWTQRIQNNAVEYLSPRDEFTRKGPPPTIIRFGYSRHTEDMPAEEYARHYSMLNQCEQPVQRGIGFFSVKCNDINTFALVIGELDNMYTLEMIGVVQPEGRRIMEQYLNNIIGGRHTFRDRNIGDPLPKPRVNVVSGDEGGFMDLPSAN